MMSPEEKTKNIKINENLSSFDIYRNSAKYSSAAASRVVLPAPKSAAHVPLSSDAAVASSTAAATNNNVLNEYDEDDEEDFISKYIIIRYEYAHRNNLSRGRKHHKKQ